ncbi:hypothetical protein BY458DRAFT_319579 [Sporodiniella umbellata]|nr:hypothetical protein BY458DRAFT_319579 [Sporodiniella umbellata]
MIFKPFTLFCTLLFQWLITMTMAQSSFNAGVAFTHPVYGDTVTRGSTYTLTWMLLDKSATTIESIGLWKGNAAYLTPVILDILPNGSIPVHPPFYQWKVPTSLTPDDYVLTVVGNNSFTSYSSTFKIQ